MISVVYSQGRLTPQVICEQCGLAIRDAGLGMVAFDENREEGRSVGLSFLHKGDCDESFREGENRGGGWTELSHFLARLCNNSAMGDKEMAEASRSADLLSEF